jgi:prepilin-type N-terminal cleavage/methylation domain-containing protein
MIARRAYTLIEVLLVITMLGIAGALVVPSLSSTEVLRVQASVRTIVGDINFAQSEALAHQRPHAIVFDLDANRYSIIEVFNGVLDPAVNTVRTVNLNNSRKFHTTMLESVDFDGQNVLVFDEMGGPVTGVGSSTPGSGGTIRITGSGSTFEVRVEAYTGRVSVRRLQ